ncbi:MAG: hypothetical protein KJZ69_13775 [Phycisphaerales bacterium]|nr:hypothetical protein [Phycisphaerales bacterium]
MTLHSDSVSLDEDGRVRINRACPAVKHAQFSVGDTQVKLETGLPNRRTLIIKPARSGTDPNRSRRWIRIGPDGFDLANGTPVWEEFELILSVSPEDEVYALKGDDEDDPVDVRILEIGEG